MFEVIDGKISPPGIIQALSDIKAWSYVTRVKFSHWFYVDCSSRTEDYAPISYLIDNVEQLLELNMDSNSIIEGAYIVFPRKDGKTIRWNMAQVKRISKVEEIELQYEKVVYIYELEDGGQYLSSASNSKHSCLVDIHTICEFP